MPGVDKYCKKLPKVLNDLQDLLDNDKFEDTSKLHGIIRYLLKYYCQSEAGLEGLVESKFARLIERIVRMSSPESVINKDVLSILYNCSKNKHLLEQLNNEDNTENILGMTKCPDLAFRSLRFITTCLKHDKLHLVSLRRVLEYELASTSSEEVLEQLAHLMFLSVANIVNHHRRLRDTACFAISKEHGLVVMSCNVCLKILNNSKCKLAMVGIIIKTMSTLLNYFDDVYLLTLTESVLQKLASDWCFKVDTVQSEDFLSFFKQFSLRNFTRAMYIEESLRNDCIIHLLKHKEGSSLELLMLVHRLCKDPAYRPRILSNEVRWAILNFIKEHYVNDDLFGEGVAIFLTISSGWEVYNQVFYCQA